MTIFFFTTLHIVLKYSVLLNKNNGLGLKFMVEILLSTTASEKEINWSHLKFMMKDSTDNIGGQKAKYEVSPS